MELSEEGIRAESEVETSQLRWNAFTQAVIFDDGVLMFQGPKMVNWIPDRALDDEADARVLRDLVTSRLPTELA